MPKSKFVLTVDMIKLKAICCNCGAWVFPRIIKDSQGSAYVHEDGKVLCYGVKDEENTKHLSQNTCRCVHCLERQ